MALDPAVLETPFRIEPCRLDEVRGELLDLVSEIPALASRLERSLHPVTAANLADHVRIMNCYYSNLIEGHNTRPRDIERALNEDLDDDPRRRDLQLEARAHIAVQRTLDRTFAEGRLPEPASPEFVRMLHRMFYHDAPDAMLRMGTGKDAFRMMPGAFRSRREEENAVGRHLPPSFNVLPAFMAHFEERYRLGDMGPSARLLAVPAAHHRFNFIHPFPDGNGRVSRLMSHAMALKAGIGAGSLWSISRGLARGLETPSEYKRMMDLADSPRQGDRDGRGNLSEAALVEFSIWFLKVCKDQLLFMSGLFDLDALPDRLRRYAVIMEWRPEAGRLLTEVFHRGEIHRGEVAQITGLKERTARDQLARMIESGILGSTTPKGPVSLRIPVSSVDILFPRLFPES